MKVAVLTAGKDPHYALGLLSGVTGKGLEVDFIGNDEMGRSDLVSCEGVQYFNLRGDTSSGKGQYSKGIQLTRYYLKLFVYAWKSDASVFHILWFNKFIYFDMSLLNVYYKMLGKKIFYTAHNIDIWERDGKKSLVNRSLLRFLYKIVDHVFVHTERMKEDLKQNFNVPDHKITTIPFGLNEVVPDRGIPRLDARKKLNIEAEEKVILFFGNIAPYKGAEYLIRALDVLEKRKLNTTLIIAGKVKKGSEEYWGEVLTEIESLKSNNKVVLEIRYILDEEVEVFFKAADLLVLPYVFIYQTGVLFLSYNFGLPAVATDTGLIKNDLKNGVNGFLCQPMDVVDLADKIQQYFNSSLYGNLDENRKKIKDAVHELHSWDKVGSIVVSKYSDFK